MKHAWFIVCVFDKWRRLDTMSPPAA